MANLLFPKELTRDFLALAASKRHSLFQNPTERTGKYRELENTCIIPSYKTFPTCWQMKEGPGACLQKVLGFNSRVFSWVKPCSKYVGSAYGVGLLGTIHLELLFPIIWRFQGQKRECCHHGESKKSHGAACRNLHTGSSVTAWRQSAPRRRCLQPCACAFLSIRSHFEL